MLLKSVLSYYFMFININPERFSSEKEHPNIDFMYFCNKVTHKDFPYEIYP